jgi:hypothetical protein
MINKCYRVIRKPAYAVELTSSENRELGVSHIVNDDSTVTWIDFLSWPRKVEDFEIVEPGAWVGRFEKHSGEAKHHPTLKLLGLWKSAYGRQNIGDGDAGCSKVPSTRWDDIQEQ